MKKILILLTAIFAFGLVACSDSETPSSTVKTYMNAIQSKNVEKAFDCVDFDKSEQDEAEMKSLIEKAEKSIDIRGGLKNYEIVSETIAEDGMTAVVIVRQTWGDEDAQEDEVELKKVNDEWKVDVGK